MPTAAANDQPTGYVKLDWRMVSLLATILIAGVSFAGASVMNYASITTRLSYLEDENKAYKNHNERLTALEKSDVAQELRINKAEARLESSIDTFQGINRDIFSNVSKISQKLDDLKELAVRFYPQQEIKLPNGFSK